MIPKNNSSREWNTVTKFPFYPAEQTQEKNVPPSSSDPGHDPGSRGWIIGWRGSRRRAPPAGGGTREKFIKQSTGRL